jgi:competence protein ComEC
MKKYALYVLAVLMLFSYLLVLTLPAEPTAPTAGEDEYLAVHFIDVGQADCILLSCGDDYMLIDGGNAADGYAVRSYLENAGVDKLDLLVATHPHEDHIGGLPTVLTYFEAETIWTTEITYSNSTIRKFLEAADKQDAPVVQPMGGETFLLGSALVTVLGPVSTNYEDVNNLSLVLMVEFEDTRFLFTGDMETLAEGDMLDFWGEEFNWKCDVLKVGHHGSYSSTGYRLLREVAPTWAVIPCGYQNEYGHPHENTLSRLRDAEVVTFRMDLMSTVIALSDGETIAFSWMNSSYEPGIPN